jgi:hypothetical protein
MPLLQSKKNTSPVCFICLAVVNRVVAHVWGVVHQICTSSEFLHAI